MGSSILQAILGGVAGGAEGISQVREQRRLEEERKAEAERRARAERLQYVSAGFVPEASVGAMDMPGATPRKPFMSAVLSDGERMVMERSPQQMQHEAKMREHQEKRGAERAAEERQAKQMGAFIESLSPEEQSRVGTALRAVQAGAPTAFAQQLVPREPERKLQLNERTGQIVDLNTGQVVNVPGYRIPPTAERGQADGKPKISDISSLRKEFNTESRPYKTIDDALRRIEVLGTKPNPTPQDMQALVYQFVKVQDPTSVVRESEYANAASAVALTDKINNFYGILAEGKRLTPNQRRDMVETARLLRQEAMSQYGQLADSYESLAESFGMKPKLVVPNRLDRSAPSRAAGGAGNDPLTVNDPRVSRFIERARAEGKSDDEIRRFLEAQRGGGR